MIVNAHFHALSLAFSRKRALSLTNAHQQALRHARTDQFADFTPRLRQPFAQFDPTFARSRQRHDPQGELVHPELQAPGERVDVVGVGAKGIEDLHGCMRRTPWMKTERSSHGLGRGRIDCANGASKRMRTMSEPRN